MSETWRSKRVSSSSPAEDEDDPNLLVYLPTIEDGSVVEFCCVVDLFRVSFVVDLFVLLDDLLLLLLLEQVLLAKTILLAPPLLSFNFDCPLDIILMKSSEKGDVECSESGMKMM